MALEDDIKELTAALRENTAALLGTRTIPMDDRVVSSGKKKAAEKPVEEVGEKAEESATEETIAEEGTGPVTYKQIEQATLALARTAVPAGRERAKMILGEYGVAKVSELDQADYSSFFSNINIAIKELSDET